MNNYTLYKPFKNKEGKFLGAASSLEFKTGEPDKYGNFDAMVFWNMAPQSGEKDGNALFDWENKITMKLGIPDLGELLAVLNGNKDSVSNNGSLYHQNAKGNTVLKFSFDKEKQRYIAQLSTKRDSDTKQYGHSFSVGEAEVLRVLLTSAVESFYKWGA